MPKVILIVDKDDRVSDLIDAIQYLNARHVTIDKECYIDSDDLVICSKVSPFEGTTQEVVEYVTERATKCDNLANTHFATQTTVTVEN